MLNIEELYLKLAGEDAAAGGVLEAQKDSVVTPPKSDVGSGNVLETGIQLGDLNKHIENSVRAGTAWNAGDGWDKLKGIPDADKLGNEHADKVIKGYLNNWQSAPDADKAMQGAYRTQAWLEQLMNEKDNPDAKYWSTYKSGTKDIKALAADHLAAVAAKNFDATKAQEALNRARLQQFAASHPFKNVTGVVGEAIGGKYTGLVDRTADVAAEAPAAADKWSGAIVEKATELRKGVELAAKGEAQGFGDWFTSNWSNWLIPAGILVAMFGDNKMLQLAGVAAAGYGGYRLYDVYNNMNTPKGKEVASLTLQHVAKGGKIDEPFLTQIKGTYGDEHEQTARTTAFLPYAGFANTMSKEIKTTAQNAARAASPGNYATSFGNALVNNGGWKDPAEQWGDKALNWWKGTSAPAAPKPPAAQAAPKP